MGNARAQDCSSGRYPAPAAIARPVRRRSRSRCCRARGEKAIEDEAAECSGRLQAGIGPAIADQRPGCRPSMCSVSCPFQCCRNGRRPARSEDVSGVARPRGYCRNAWPAHQMRRGVAVSSLFRSAENDRNPPDLGLADARYEPSAVLPKPQGVALAAFPRPIGCAATLSQASVCSAVWGSPLRRVLVRRPTDAVEHWRERHRSTVLLPPTVHSADSERPARHG